MFGSAPANREILHQLLLRTKW